MKFLESYTSIIALAAGCAGLGCSAKVVDLGNNPAGQGSASGPIYSEGPPPTSAPSTANSVAADAGATPFRIVDREQSGCAGIAHGSMTAFTVVSGRLFWVSPSLTEISYRYLFRSCEVDHCASSMVASDYMVLPGIGCSVNEPPSADRTVMEADQDTVYWFNSISPDGNKMVSQASGSKISDVTFPGGGSIFVDNGVLYSGTSENTVLRCVAADCKNTIERFAMTPPSGANTFVGGGIFGQDKDYLYLVENISVNGNSRILRVPKDISAAFEELGNLPVTRFVSLTVHGSDFYWLEDVVLGELKSCPKSGCVGLPTTVMSGLYRPSEMAFDESSVYALEPTQVAGNSDSLGDFSVVRPGRILKCPIAGCSNPEVIFTSTTEAQLQNLVVDDRYVYFGGNYCTSTNQPHNYPFFEDCAFIAAIPK